MAVAPVNALSIAPDQRRPRLPSAYLALKSLKFIGEFTFLDDRSEQFTKLRRLRVTEEGSTKPEPVFTGPRLALVRQSIDDRLSCRRVEAPGRSFRIVAIYFCEWRDVRHDGSS